MTMVLALLVVLTPLGPAAAGSILLLDPPLVTTMLVVFLQVVLLVTHLHILHKVIQKLMQAPDLFLLPALILTEDIITMNITTCHIATKGLIAPRCQPILIIKCQYHLLHRLSLRSAATRYTIFMMHVGTEKQRSAVTQRLLA